MSTLEDLHCTGDVTIDGDLLVQGGPIDIPVTILMTDKIDAVFNQSKYIPHLKLTVLNVRLRRKTSFTFDGTEKGTSWDIISIPSQYAPAEVSTACYSYTGIGSLSAEINCSIDADGLIKLRMNGKTNPEYFYIGGIWFAE